MIRRRLLTLVPTVFGVVTLVFLFLHAVPGDPVDVMLGETARAADKELLRAELGLDRPVGEPAPERSEVLSQLVQVETG